jgi:glycosidase
LNNLDSDVYADEANWTNVYGGELMGHFFGSHDVPRAITIADSGNTGDPWNNPPGAPSNPVRAFGRLRLAQAFLFTYDSIPIIWMGDEYGQPGAVDPDNRRMMSFDSQLSSDQTNALNFFKKVGSARKAHSALRRGSRTTLWADSNLYAYSRIDGGDIVIVVLNRNESPAPFNFGLQGANVTGSLNDALGGSAATVSGTNLTGTVSALTAAIYTNN